MEILEVNLERLCVDDRKDEGESTIYPAGTDLPGTLSLEGEPKDGYAERICHRVSLDSQQGR